MCHCVSQTTQHACLHLFPIYLWWVDESRHFNNSNKFSNQTLGWSFHKQYSYTANLASSWPCLPTPCWTGSCFQSSPYVARISKEVLCHLLRHQNRSILHESNLLSVTTAHYMGEQARSLPNLKGSGSLVQSGRHLYCCRENLAWS